MMALWMFIVLLSVLTAFSAFCASSETAFFSLPSSKIHIWRNSSDPRQRLVSRLLAHSRHLIVLIFILNNTTNILIQNVASDLAESLGSSWVLKLGLPLILILVFGEFFPKYIGMQFSELLTVRAAPIFAFLSRVIGPVQRMITAVAETLSRIIFFFLKPETPLSQKELDQVIETCEEKGVLSAEEASLIQHALDFERKQVREIMTPRSSMPAIKRSQFKLKSLLELMRATSKKTIILIDEHMDRLIGAISTHEAMLLHQGDIEAALARASRQLFFVPEAMSARRVFQEFTERQKTVACVVDEHGTVSGFVEWDDLVKRLLGFQQKRVGVNPSTSKPPLKSITVAGSTPLEVVNSSFQVSLESEYHSTTIGGWLVEMLDRIPTVGTSFLTDELIFRVLSSDDKVVKQVFIQRREKTAEDIAPLKEAR
jgi:CBS domain containing-hemolysin-like protein